MTTKKGAKPRKATLDSILSTVERGFTAVTDDIADLKTELKSDISGIMEELADIKRRLNEIESAIEDHAGHSKEIDHALERIAAIERHLGIKHPAH
jgi:predicted  nucleic acid-binding Zn-ribbon protein